MECDCLCRLRIWSVCSIWRSYRSLLRIHTVQPYELPPSVFLLTDVRLGDRFASWTTEVAWTRFTSGLHEPLSLQIRDLSLENFTNGRVRCDGSTIIECSRTMWSRLPLLKSARVNAVPFWGSKSRRVRAPSALSVGAPVSLSPGRSLCLWQGRGDHKFDWWMSQCPVCFSGVREKLLNRNSDILLWKGKLVRPCPTARWRPPGRHAIKHDRAGG